MENSRVLGLDVESKVTTEKKSILVVDDAVDMLELQKIILEMEGFEVYTAQFGRAALKILCEINPPALILLDVQMGDMTGPEFLAMLKDKNPEIADAVPVVFLTGMDQIPEGPVQGFIRKPFEISKFLKAVHRFIDLGNHQPRFH